jgi:hypothetical protein
VHENLVRRATKYSLVVDDNLYRFVTHHHQSRLRT